MRFAAVLLLFLAVSRPADGAAAVRDGTAATVREPCGAGGGRTLERTPQARAYVRGTTVFACARGTGRAFRLDAQFGCYGDSCAGLRQVRVAGRYVAAAFVLSDGGSGDDLFTLSVRDARTGRVVSTETVGSPAILRAGIDRLVVDARGHVAFTWTRVDAPGREIRRSPGCGPRVVATGTDIERRSLALRDGTIHWRQAGAARSAPLCAP